MKAFATTLRTDLRLAARNPDMILFGIVFPVAVMLLLGLVSKPEAARLDFGGVVAFGVCASGLMGLPLTLSDYRHRKVLKRIRVTPASPSVLLFSQILVQCGYILVSSGAVCLVAGLAFGLGVASPGAFALYFLLTAVSTLGIGLVIASLCPNMKVANAVASLAYFPTIFLTGATVPFEILPRGLQAAVQVLPMTQGIKLLKSAVIGAPAEGTLVPVIVLSAVAILAYTVAIRLFRWE